MEQALKPDQDTQAIVGDGLAGMQAMCFVCEPSLLCVGSQGSYVQFLHCNVLVHVQINVMLECFLSTKMVHIFISVLSSTRATHVACELALFVGSSNTLTTNGATTVSLCQSLAAQARLHLSDTLMYDSLGASGAQIYVWGVHRFA